MWIARFRSEKQINTVFTHPHLDKLTELATTVLERQSPVSVCQRMQLMGTVHKERQQSKLQRKEAKGCGRGTYQTVWTEKETR
jgi:hypothetical protein